MKLSRILYYLTILSIGVFAKRKRIIGGEDVNIQEFPYQAALVFPISQKFLCGAAIISHRNVLTAAHCLYQGDYYHEMLRVYTGISNINSDVPRMFALKEIHIHPQYTGEVNDDSMSTHDIAVIKVDGRITFNAFQNKIDLPTINYFPGRNAVITGFGMTQYPSEEKSSQLQRASVNIITRYTCEQYFEFNIRIDQLCTLQRVGVGVCIGDSGGPVAANGKLIGIISFNAPCAKGVPDVHTNVFSFLSFIRSHMTDT